MARRNLDRGFEITMANGPKSFPLAQMNQNLESGTVVVRPVSLSKRTLPSMISYRRAVTRKLPVLSVHVRNGAPVPACTSWLVVASVYSPTTDFLTQFDAPFALAFVPADSGTHLIRIAANDLTTTGSYELGLTCP